MSDTVTKSSEALAAKLDPLRPLAERVATVRYPVKKLYSSCLRASFVKAFEFVDLVSKQEYDTAFFFAPVLRGITEDIIVLRFLSRFPHECREKVVKNLQFYLVHRNLERQKSFFQTFRSFQRVLSSPSVSSESALGDLRSFWQTNGWPNLKDHMPPTRQIAEKSDPGILEVVYDFIYRLTSDIVHFNPQVLLRSGWGVAPREATFSSKNMGKYYLSMSRVYGSYLFCLYFELFGRFLRPNQKEKAGVIGMREYLLGIPRWPEMITFEEMNFELPRPSSIVLRALHNVIMKDGFISGTKRLIALHENHRS